MARDYTRFTVRVSKKYDLPTRKAIAFEIIDHIIRRSESGEDKDNNQFATGYSKEYEESIPGKAAGKKAGQTPNLKLTGEMLESLEYLDQSEEGEITIGYRSPSQMLAGKAEGNIRGSYGKPRGNSKLARDFMGISRSDKTKILKDFPLKDIKKLKKNVELVKQAKKKAKT